MKPMQTRVALAGYDSIEVRGRSILSGSEHAHDRWSMFSIGLGHRELTPRECEVIDVVSNITCIGDPRLWPFRATRIVATYGDVYLASAAATAFNSGGKLVSPAIRKSMEQMEELRVAVGDDATVDEIKAYLEPRLERGEIIAGYYVVARPTDERHDFMKPWCQDNGWYAGPYMQQTLKIDDAMWELKAIRPNIVALWAGIFLDLGFSPVQGEQVGLTAWQWSVHANIAEVVGSDDYDELKRLPDSFVAWHGTDDRMSPRAQVPDPDLIDTGEAGR